MGLVRVTTQLASVIIKQLGDSGGTLRRDVESEIDSIIAWARLSPRCIDSFAPVTPVGNIGAGVDDLHSFTLDTPNRLLTNGDWIRFAMGGAFAVNDNDKRVRILIDGQVIEDFGLFDFDTGEWRAEGEIVRVSATTVRVSYMGMYGEPLVLDEGVVSGTPDVIFLPRTRLLTVSNLSSNAIVIKAQAEATANDDVTQNLSILELFQQ